MYRARERIEHRQWIEELERIADELGLSSVARTHAIDLFLAGVPEADRSKRTGVAASIYAGALVAGEGCSQGAVGDVAGVSRLSIQQHWKDRLAAAGLKPPDW
ncbi:MAG: transcription initiation factor IIB family protein [Natrialbaceae archaeon]|nr:transcription initiation factor IIB family protein [Natrialbaceae archaeon]